jgi:hypothetical protein
MISPDMDQLRSPISHILLLALKNANAVDQTYCHVPNHVARLAIQAFEERRERNSTDTAPGREVGGAGA